MGQASNGRTTNSLRTRRLLQQVSSLLRLASGRKNKSKNSRKHRKTERPTTQKDLYRQFSVHKCSSATTPQPTTNTVTPQARQDQAVTQSHSHTTSITATFTDVNRKRNIQTHTLALARWSVGINKARNVGKNHSTYVKTNRLGIFRKQRQQGNLPRHSIQK